MAVEVVEEEESVVAVVVLTVVGVEVEVAIVVVVAVAVLEVEREGAAEVIEDVVEGTLFAAGEVEEETAPVVSLFCCFSCEGWEAPCCGCDSGVCGFESCCCCCCCC